MDFIKHPDISFGRTLYKADGQLFASLLNSGVSKETDVIDQRLLVMSAIGLLNRTLNLEEYLVAVIGQKWTFKKQVKTRETLSVKYEIQEKENSKRFIYNIHIDLMASNDELIAQGIWTIMLNQKL